MAEREQAGWCSFYPVWHAVDEIVRHQISLPQEGGGGVFILHSLHCETVDSGDNLEDVGYTPRTLNHFKG